MKIFTIGHSNHSIASFIENLKQNGITAVADVRSSPYSQRFPHFNQSAFKKALQTVDIAYVSLGDNLGARPNDRSCYVEGMARYDLISATKAFATGLNRLIKGAEQHQISLMCAEQDPIVCHRAILVCPHLKKTGLEINHIHKNGDLESHECLEDRLLKQHNLYKLLPDNQNCVKQLSLFDMRPIDTIEKTLSRQELIEKAYQLQGDRIAYVERKYTETEDSHERAS
ncbi:hypothetical protein A2T98_22120 [Nodularia spumigena CENA596]|uniref:DUF488 domain-containing protein n=1 Tax=Nodularia spumigena CENA596 TaxID=1819295 RepID=A0A166HYT9_NODSP|nr:DUF488 domain-containing protein [Nodularia spumigena]KZL47627.1 hypothetical protein A2T98_22120 [Nodularia spumigena CENA596]